jgi:transposase
MNEMGVSPAYHGNVVYDYWKSYLDYDYSHSLCNTHYECDLTFFMSVI